MINFLRGKAKSARGSATAGEIAGLVAFLVVVALVVGAIYWWTARGSAAANQRCVVYSGGWIEDKEFQEFLEPGTTNAIIGFGSANRCYWTDQRSFIGSRDEGSDGPPVQVVCRGDEALEEAVGGASQLEVTFDYNLYFTLNTSDDALKEFDKEIGQKTKAYTKDGWREMLRDYFKPQITRAMQNAGNYSCLDLYGDPEVRAEYQRDVVRNFSAQLENVVKGEFFCDPGFTGEGECGDITFTVGNPRLPDGIKQAIEARIEAAQATQRQAEENAKLFEALKADQDLVDLYGPEGALIWKALENDQITFYVLPDGSTTSVPVPQPGG